MSRGFIKWVLALSVVLATGSVVFGQDYNKGVEAYERGPDVKSKSNCVACHGGGRRGEDQ